MMPGMPPMVQQMSDAQSSLMRMKKMEKAAADIPQAWIISEKSRAMYGATLKAIVITGKATAPPPTLVMPGRNIIDS